MIDQLYQTSKLAQQYADGIAWQVERRYTGVIERIKQLKPGARRLLLVLHRLLEQTKLRPVNRNQIALALRHTKLHHHDLKLIERLIASGWIVAQRVSLPKDSDNMPRGFEYRYSMDIDTAWLISLVRSKQKPVFKSEPHIPTKTAANLSKQNQPVKPDYSQPDNEPWYFRVFDRVMSLFGL